MKQGGMHWRYKYVYKLYLSILNISAEKKEKNMRKSMKSKEIIDRCN